LEVQKCQQEKILVKRKEINKFIIDTASKISLLSSWARHRREKLKVSKLLSKKDATHEYYRAQFI
jgi:hypothetical protein